MKELDNTRLGVAGYFFVLAICIYFVLSPNLLPIEMGMSLVGAFIFSILFVSNLIKYIRLLRKNKK